MAENHFDLRSPNEYVQIDTWSRMHLINNGRLLQNIVESM